MLSILPFNNRNFAPKSIVPAHNSAVVRPFAHDSVNFTGLMPNRIIKALKMCVFDLDESLLEGPLEVRRKVCNFVREQGKVLIYSSARPIAEVKRLVANNELIMPDFCVCANGAHIYENVNGQMEEVSAWANQMTQNFNKDKINQFMTSIARKHMFSAHEWEKRKPSRQPGECIEYLGSKVGGYNGIDSPLDVRFAVNKDVLDEVIKEATEVLKQKGIDAKVYVHYYTAAQTTLERYKRYYTPEKAEDVVNTVNARRNPDGGYNCLVITAKTDKGKATEYIRKNLRIKRREVLAAGDDINDSSHTDKHYFFIMLGNATQNLKDYINKLPFRHKRGLVMQKIYTPEGHGACGIWEVIEPD